MEQQERQDIRQLHREFASSQKLLSALGDEQRQRLLLLLLAQGPQGARANDLTEQAQLTRSAVTHHLQILKDAGLLSCRKEGKFVYYYLEPKSSDLAQLQVLLEHLRSLMGQRPMNLLVTLNSGYLHQLCVMLSSAMAADPQARFHLYILHSSLTEEDLEQVRQVLGERHQLFPIKVEGEDFADAPTTGRYPAEMYYRIFAAQYLPQDLERVLYLDPDITVLGSLRGLYEMDLEQVLFAAASHVGNMMTRLNSVRLESKEEDSPYINSGVMLMNLRRLRQEQRREDVYQYIEKHRSKLILPDQDVISGLYGPEIQLLDANRYNMTERIFALHPDSEAWLDLDWVRDHAVIIHYCGRNKPWKPGYVGSLGQFYKEAEAAYLARWPQFAPKAPRKAKTTKEKGE